MDNAQDECSWHLDTLVFHTGTGKGAKLPDLHSDPEESVRSCGLMDSLSLVGVGVALLEECVTVGVGSYAQAIPSVGIVNVPCPAKSKNKPRGPIAESRPWGLERAVLSRQLLERKT